MCLAPPLHAQVRAAPDAVACGFDLSQVTQELEKDQFNGIFSVNARKRKLGKTFTSFTEIVCSRI